MALKMRYIWVGVNGSFEPKLPKTAVVLNVRSGFRRLLCYIGACAAYIMGQKMNLATLRICATFLILSLCAVLQGCTTASEQEAALEPSLNERSLIGQRLEERLFSIKSVKPTFSSRQNIQRFEREVLSKFINTLPSGNLIFGGFPAYWIELDRQEMRVNTQIRGDFAPVFDVTYQITLKTSDSDLVVARARHTGRCIESEAIFTSPTRCSLLRPYVLRAALEKL